jgi:two-component system nitrogen regulation sensor histidine kinase NtrY
LANERANESNRGLTERGRKRLATVIVLSILTLLLLLSLIAQSSFNLSPLVSPDTAGETLLLYALSTLNFFAFVTVLFVLLRNVLKVLRERRARRLGSKFKARLVIYSIGLSLLPVLLLFFFEFGLINRSIDRWFGEPPRKILDDAHKIEEGSLKRQQSDLKAIARAIATALGLAERSEFKDSEFQRKVRREMADYDLSVARLIAPGERLTVLGAGKGMDQETEDRLEAAEQLILSGQEIPVGDENRSPTVHLISGLKVQGGRDGPRMLVLAREEPRAANIDEDYRVLEDLRRGEKGIKDRNILLLSLVALLLIFASSWLALYVARGISVPIQALVEATDRVAHGDFTGKVDVMAEDELAALVESFNQMAGQLAESRRQLELAAEDLHRTNVALDDRRRYIETVLETLSTGVISTDERAGIAFINRAAVSILGFSERPPVGAALAELLGGPQGEELAALCRRARRVEMAQADIEFPRADGAGRHTATTALALRDSLGVLVGWVIVIEDLTDVIHAERAAAWSEVARRMAHEIKNPLTPIQLSAERIIRNYERSKAISVDSRFDVIVKEGTATIAREVGMLQRMVEEFSRFARLPETRPVEASLNDVVNDAVRLYAGRLDGIKMQCNLAEDLPKMQLDAEQIKRALVNLIDNAIEALTVEGGSGSASGRTVAASGSDLVGGSDGASESHGTDTRSNTDGISGSHGTSTPSGSDGVSQSLRSIKIESRYERVRESAIITVSDTGHGIDRRDRDKLFLPKFSTRERGTGLGLAIVSQIISNHKGRIWVEDNQPRGARFVIELPLGNHSDLAVDNYVVDQPGGAYEYGR